MNKRYNVFLTPEEQPGEKGKGYWARVGSAYLNDNGTMTVLLYGIPVRGKLQIRDEENETMLPGGSRYNVVSREKGQTTYTQLGSAFINKDSSINLNMFMYPTDLRMTIEPLEQEPTQPTPSQKTNTPPARRRVIQETDPEEEDLPDYQNKDMPF